MGVAKLMEGSGDDAGRGEASDDLQLGMIPASTLKAANDDERLGRW